MLWAVLRMGRPLDLSLRDVLNCAATCKALRELAWEHCETLEYLGSDLHNTRWWQECARLCSVTHARLDVSAAPRLASFSHLRSLQLLTEDHAGVLVDLQPLSSLQQLDVLDVAPPATGVQALPPVRRLQINPGTAQDLRDLGQHTQLVFLAVAHSNNEDGECQNPQAYQPEDFAGICSLPLLEELDMYLYHLPMVGNGTSLVTCPSLRDLDLGCFSCSCIDPEVNLAELAVLTQLTALCLSFATAWELDSLVLDSMPALRVLQLQWPEPFVAETEEMGCELPHFCVPCLWVTFIASERWSAVQQALADILAAHKHWLRRGAASFTLLSVEEWPTPPCPAETEAVIQKLLRKFVRSNVGFEVLSAAAIRAGSPTAVQDFGLTHVDEHSDTDSLDSDSGSDWD